MKKPTDAGTPDWVFRPWISRRVFQGSYEAHRILRTMHDLDVPAGVLMLENWFDPAAPEQFDTVRFTRPLSWVSALRDLGVEVVGRVRDEANTPRARRRYQTWHGRQIQTYEFMHLGEFNATWEALPRIVRAGLTASYNGHAIWHHDIGGTSGTPPKELYIRWLQLGTFSPIMLLHGDTPREPWRYDEETLNIARFYFAMRDRLRPLLHRWLEEFHDNGRPIVRPMALDFPDDPDALAIDSQFFFGPDLLVAPQLTPDGRRSVYLPEGRWRNAWTQERMDGPARFQMEAPLYKIPVFIREEQAEPYRDFFSNPPIPSHPEILVERAGATDARGLVPHMRFADPFGNAERVMYQITNDSNVSVPVGVRCAPVPGLRIDPDEVIRFQLAAGASREVHFDIWPLPMTPPGTYWIPLEVRAGVDDIPTPEVHVVVAPEWRALGLFEGGVGAPSPVDGLVPQLDAVYSGRNDRPIRWIELPPGTLHQDGRIDIGMVLGDIPFSTCFLHTTIHSRWARRIRLWTGSGDALAVWVNGRQVSDRPVHRNPERDEDMVEAVLMAGDNDIILRIQRDRAPFHIYFRIE